MAGFELEMKVSLSRKGKHKVETREDLQGMAREELKDDQAIEVEDGKVFEWDEDSEGPRALEDALALKDGGKGRWHANPARGSRVGKEISKLSPEENEYFDPLLGKDEKVVSATKEQPFSVVEDYDNQLKSDMMGEGNVRSVHSAIAEIVTEPRDEWIEPIDFVDPMAKASEAAAKIEGQTEGLTKRIPAKSVFPAAPEDIYLGLEMAKEEKVFQSTNAAIQATFGIQLGGVAQLMAGMLQGPTRSKPAEKNVLGGAIEAATVAMKSLAELGIFAPEVPRLNGLLHLIAMYLVAGEQGANILKNKTPLLIRNHLANIRVQGLGKEAERLTPKAIELIHKTIIKAAKRDPEDALMTGVKGSPTVAAWVTHALEGEVDQDPLVPLLGDMRKLGPEPVGPKGAQEEAPVVEERQVPKREGIGVDIPRSAWPDLAVGYQNMLRKLNSPKMVESSAPKLESKMLEELPPFQEFGGELSLKPKSEEELPEFGAGLPVGTLVEKGPLEGEIVEDDSTEGVYMIQFKMKSTQKALPNPTKIGYTAQGLTVVKLG